MELKEKLRQILKERYGIENDAEETGSFIPSHCR